jgi:hydrogenase maturation protease
VSGPVVVGVGNDWRGDDAAGLVVARRLRAAGIPAVEAGGDPAVLLDAWAGASHAIVVDAVRSGAAPGTVHRLDAGRLPDGLRAGSTHALGLAEAIALARTLGRLPARLEIYGIEAGQAQIAADLTPAVARAVAALGRELRERLSRAAPAER